MYELSEASLSTRNRGDILPEQSQAGLLRNTLLHLLTSNVFDAKWKVDTLPGLILGKMFNRKFDKSLLVCYFIY